MIRQCSGLVVFFGNYFLVKLHHRSSSKRSFALALYRASFFRMRHSVTLIFLQISYFSGRLLCFVHLTSWCSRSSFFVRIRIRCYCHLQLQDCFSLVDGDLFQRNVYGLRLCSSFQKGSLICCDLFLSEVQLSHHFFVQLSSLARSRISCQDLNVILSVLHLLSFSFRQSRDAYFLSASLLFTSVFSFFTVFSFYSCQRHRFNKICRLCISNSLLSISDL